MVSPLFAFESVGDVYFRGFLCCENPAIYLLLSAPLPLGVAGGTIDRELPNGWIFRLTSSCSFELDGRDYFKIGIRPGIFLNDGFDSAVLKEAVNTIRSQP